MVPSLTPLESDSIVHRSSDGIIAEGDLAVETDIDHNISGIDSADSCEQSGNSKGTHFCGINQRDFL